MAEDQANNLFAQEVFQPNMDPTTWLTRLAQVAFTSSDPAQKPLLDLNTQQQQKYGRWQFTFDPQQGADYYIGLIQQAIEAAREKDELMGDSFSAEDIFNLLENAHPTGVEIWVNPNNANRSPLAENMALLSIDSIFTAAKKMCAEQNLDLSSIEAAHHKARQQIEFNYDKKPIDPRADYKYCKQIVRDFQRFVVTQLASQKNNNDSLATAKALAQYENQRPDANDPHARQFCHNILTINLSDADNKFDKASITLHDRQVEDKESRKKQITASAHSPEYQLANAAEVHEGLWNSSTQIFQPEILDHRHGSPAPVILSEGKKNTLHKKRKSGDEDLHKHKNTYYAYRNMEQYLAQLCDGNDDATMSNIHTHLITPTGIGSRSHNQHYQFLDSRVAAYATWENACSPGYIYSCFGVNDFRKDSGRGAAFDKLLGTNNVALIALYRKVLARHPLPQDTSLGFTEYDEHLNKVIQASKDYMTYMQQHESWLTDENFSSKKLKQEIAQLEQQIEKQEKRANKPHRVEEWEKVKELKETLAAKKKTLEDITTFRSELKTQREAFKAAEKALHSTAKSLNQDIYQQLQQVPFNNVDGENRQRYLAWQGIYWIQHLFHEKSGLFHKWQSEHYNGVLQGLIHLVADQAGFSASGGCKSANDREMLVALIVSELAKLTHDENRELDAEYLSSLAQRAQAQYAFHPSHRQTALDRSGSPKGKAFFGHADEKIVNAHAQYGKFAAHKRSKAFKKEDPALLKTLSKETHYLMACLLSRKPGRSLNSIIEQWRAYCNGTSDNLEKLKKDLNIWLKQHNGVISRLWRRDSRSAAKWLQQQIAIEERAALQKAPRTASVSNPEEKPDKPDQAKQELKEANPAKAKKAEASKQSQPTTRDTSTAKPKVNNTPSNTTRAILTSSAKWGAAGGVVALFSDPAVLLTALSMCLNKYVTLLPALTALLMQMKVVFGVSAGAGYALARRATFFKKHTQPPGLAKLAKPPEAIATTTHDAEPAPQQRPGIRR
jgi:hypothetical protein